ncbi:MAG TPA: MFS transporter [Chthoniobacterales bacterium]|jgi:MFS transporter, FSR family, fosmidomycin resistance protein|nr:MFS transporter [Chthoniobacterales bacterium]
MTSAATPTVQPKAYIAVLLLLGSTHLLNDLIQALIPAIYPIIKDKYALDFVQIGIITLTFQIAGSLLQPLVGHYTDQHPMPYSTAIGMIFTLVGVLSLAFSASYLMILVSVACIGVGSSIYHPEATRMARYASGNRQGLAQGIFQVGGQVGGALSPLLAALIIVPRGQTTLSWFAALVILAMVLMIGIARQHTTIRTQFLAATSSHSGASASHRSHSRAAVWLGLGVLSLLMFSKLAYVESFRSFYTFYLIDRFGVSIGTSQLMLFIFFLSSAAGVLLGGIVGDKIGRYNIIWISILGPLPLTLLLPHVDFFWTGVLTVLINLIMASAFASIMIYAMELVSHRIGLIGGLFYGLSFGMGGIAAAILGGMADRIGIERVYQLCSFLPLVGLLTVFLPRITDHRTTSPAKGNG